MELWAALLDVLVLLVAAFFLGSLAERLRQSALLGYLAAGMILGPHALNLLPSHEAVAATAELGVALLLFTIGIEFSWPRLRRMGAVAFGGGSLQILVTLVVSAGVGAALGLSWRAALAVGAILALSSTAAVLRLLVGRAEMDSVHGRNALGILLFQDVSVVPLVFFSTLLARESLIPEFGWSAAARLGVAAAGGSIFFLIVRYILPVLFRSPESSRNRDLPILLAAATVIGASWGSHRLGLTPALGSFIAGIVLGESPFATQIRADVAPLRTLFVTLFFCSIGTQADPVWAVQHAGPVLGLVAAIVLFKTLVAAIVLRPFHAPTGIAVATGLCIAQVGEFSFVLIQSAEGGAVIDANLSRLLLTATTGTLLVTPFLVAVAPRVALGLERRRAPKGIVAPSPPNREQVLIVGFGPAGKAVAEGLRSLGMRFTVLDLNPKSIEAATLCGFRGLLGDARSPEVLESQHLENALAVVVTVPDPHAARQIVETVRSLAPRVLVIVRGRYHVFRDELIEAGANDVIDEEEEVGERIATRVAERLMDLG